MNIIPFVVLTLNVFVNSLELKKSIEERYIDLLTPEKKVSFLFNIARRIENEVKSEGDPVHPDVELSDDQLDVNSEYVHRILKEEAEHDSHEERKHAQIGQPHDKEDNPEQNGANSKNGEANEKLEYATSEAMKKLLRIKRLEEREKITSSMPLQGYDVNNSEIPVQVVYDESNDKRKEKDNAEVADWLEKDNLAKKSNVSEETEVTSDKSETSKMLRENTEPTEVNTLGEQNCDDKKNETSNPTTTSTTTTTVTENTTESITENPVNKTNCGEVRTLQDIMLTSTPIPDNKVNCKTCKKKTDKYKKCRGKKTTTNVKTTENDINTSNDKTTISDSTTINIKSTTIDETTTNDKTTTTDNVTTTPTDNDNEPEIEEGNCEDYDEKATDSPPEKNENILRVDKENSKVSQLEHKHYIPVYNYEIKNAFFNSHNRFGPNYDDSNGNMDLIDPKLLRSNKGLSLDFNYNIQVANTGKVEGSTGKENINVRSKPGEVNLVKIAGLIDGMSDTNAKNRIFAIRYNEYRRHKDNKKYGLRESEPDSEGMIKANLIVLKDLIEADSEELEGYDWVGSTIDILSSLENIFKLLNMAQTGQEMNPYDKQLLCYLIYIYKNAYLKLHMKGWNSRRYKRRNPLPRFLTYVSQMYASNYDWYTITGQAGTQYWKDVTGEQKERQYTDPTVHLKAFLMSLENNLMPLHKTMKEISLKTTYKHQYWYRDIKRLYLKELSTDKVVKLLMHLMTVKLLDLVRRNLNDGLTMDWEMYVKKNGKAVRRTTRQLYVVMRLVQL